MVFGELLIVAVGLSMDAFAAAVSKGLSTGKMDNQHAMVVGSFFGGSQALMPLLGYLLGVQFSHYITAFDHWVAFLLLAFIGLRMIKESRQAEPTASDDFDLKHLGLMAVATSIDALAVGVALAFLRADIAPAAILIGTITFVLSFTGVKAGGIFGEKYRARAEVVGGIVLIAIGTRILLGHLGVIGA